MSELKELILKQFDKYYKKIPKRGLDNMDWFGSATLPDRCWKLRCAHFYLPPQLLYASKMSDQDYEELKEKATKCLSAMIRFRNKLQAVTHLRPKVKADCILYADEAKQHLELNLKKTGIIIASKNIHLNGGS